MVLHRLILRSTQFIKSKVLNNVTRTNSILRLFSTNTCLAAERRYTDKHEWIELNGKIGTVGISHYAQESLGDVVFAQLPDVGTTLKQDDECGALESVKAASEIYSPVSGRVTEKNNSVEDTPSLINSSCYDKGWLFKIELTDEKEVPNLMDEKQYDTFIKTDEH